MYSLVFIRDCLMIFLLCGPATPDTLKSGSQFVEEHNYKMTHIYQTMHQTKQRANKLFVMECRGDDVDGVDDLFAQADIWCVTELTEIARLLNSCNTRHSSFHGQISTDHRWLSQLSTLKLTTLETWEKIFAEKGVHCKSVEITDSAIAMHLESYFNEIYTIFIKKGQIRVKSGNFKTSALRVLLISDLKKC